ncbi:hypothetical protein GCM10009801_69200 [Streptomyces albiaxialis]|uniref:Uncharacterized protein n=1 Tax=Streptomyces albiaxialis TaxID=329523 RepID=A0ABN2WSJ5_9ACTN
MRTMKSVHAVRKDAAAVAAGSGPETGAEGIDTGDLDSETFESYRVNCPDCGQPIALFAQEENLPVHALCATPWDPFGLTMCQGAGRPVADAAPSGDGEGETRERAVAELLTLPEGLDWRTQPFSHVGGPGSRPMRRERVPAQR